MDKYIFKKSNALNLDQCQYFIDYIDKCPSHQKNFDKERGYISPQEANPTKLFPPYQWKKLENIVTHCMDEYVSLHPFLTDINGATWGLDLMVKLQKYLPGNYYKLEHCEHGVWMDSPKRILAWMVYLNDIKEGGGTCWPQQNFISTPRGGDLYIWPAFWTHSHYGIVAPNETKYILTSWASLS